MANILVVSPLASHPPQNGARRRIHGLLTALKARGHRIHYVYTVCEKVDIGRVTELMRADWDSVDVLPTGSEFTRSLGADYGVDDWTLPETAHAIGELARCYEATHCLVNYVFQSAYLEHLPEGILRILDTHDQLSRRQIFEDLGLEPGFFYTTQEDEMRGLARADIVLSIQDNEAEYFAQAGRPVIVVGHLADVDYMEGRYNRFERIGYIGANNKFNQQALEEFIPAFARYAQTLDQPLTLRISGNICRHFSGRLEFEFDCVSYDGFVRDIGAYLRDIDLYVNPTLTGTGLKIKSVEALSYGMPVVSTQTGWDGLPAEPGFHDAANTDELIAAIDKVRNGGFDILTRLSNFSKASFAEYRLNLVNNLDQLFDQPVQDSLAWARKHPHFIGNRQDENPDFVTLDKAPPQQPGPVRLAHVVNPVRMPKGSDLYIAQPIAFRSMRRAQAATTAARVELIARRFPEDQGYLSDCFDQELPLIRSAQDFPALAPARKLPLLADIYSLDGLPDHVTHVVYTNSDIGLQPQFYDYVASCIAQGIDALVINRRTMPKSYTRPDELARLQGELGEPHPGYDCFVVSRELLERCNFADTLIGVHLIGRVVFWNILAHARQIRYDEAAHLTFHIGDDVPSKGRKGLPYIRHNLLEGAKVAGHLRKTEHQVDPARFERFDRALQVSPGEIQGRFDPAGDRRNRVMMHSFFRTGSTYIYQKVRRQKDWTAYYEPFHEDLSIFTPSRLDEFRQRHADSRFRHKKDDSNEAWLFREYEALLDPGVTGVRGYDRRMSYIHEFEDAPKLIRTYLDGLTEESRQENVFLQFNRSALRQKMLHELFPDDSHIYLSRGIRDIWGSYLSFRNEAVYGFLRNNLAVLAFNAATPLMQALGDHVPLASIDYMEFFHSRFCEVFHHYTLEQHYLIHATFWHEAQRQASEVADVIIDMEQVAKSRMTRLETEARLAALRMNVSFKDMNYRRYDSSETLISSETMSEIEDLAQQIVISARDAAAPRPEGLLPKPRHTELQRAAERFAKFSTQTRSDRLLKHRERAIRHAPLPKPVELNRGYRVIEMEEAGWLALGFHPVENYHVWGSGQVSLLRFGLPDEVLAKGLDVMVELRLHSHPLIVPRQGETDLLVNGSHVRTLKLGTDWENHQVTIPYEKLLESDGVLDIGFFVPHVFDGRGLNKRTLSVCLSRMKVSVASK